MIILYIALILLAVFTLIAYIAANGLVSASFLRVKDAKAVQNGFFEDMEKHGLGEQVGMIKRAGEYVAALPHEDVYIKSYDGLRLHAKYYPLGDSRKTIILAHGYKSFGEHDFGCAFETYRSKGLNILLIDQRTHGESEGKYITFGVRERYDIRDWCKYLDERSGGKVKIILGGISMGCTSVLLAAGLDDISDNVCAVVADCGFISAREQFHHVMKNNYRLPSFPILNIGELICRHRGGFGFSDCSALDAVRKIKVPVLFIHGEADDFVPPDNSRRNYEACASAHKELVTVPGAGHGMSFLIDNKSCLAALDRLLETV